MTAARLHRPLYHYKSWRMYVLLLLCLCVFVNFQLQTNLGMGLVCMVNTTAVSPVRTDLLKLSSYEESSLLQQCPTLEDDNSDLGYKGTFIWSTFEQSLLVSAVYYTCILTVPLGGTLADRFNAKYIILGALTTYTLLTLLAPTLANLSYYTFLGGRFSMGLVDGLIFPAVTAVLARWFPPSERSTAAAVYTSGGQLAVVVNSIMSPALCKIDALNGWPFIFYTCALMAVVSILIVFVFLSNRPSECRWVGEKERNYLVEKLEAEHGFDLQVNKPPVPYLKILTSLAVWSAAANDFAYNFSYVMFSVYLPQFLRDVMHMNLADNGLFTAAPFLVIVLVKIPLASLADYIKHRKIMSVTATCKVMQTFACVGTAATFASLAYFVDCSRPTLALFLLVMFGVTFSGEIAGAFTSILFMAPPFVGTVSSMVTFVGMLAAIVAPVVFSTLNVNNTPEEYANVFYVSSLVNLLSGLFFVFFGSGGRPVHAARLARFRWAMNESRLNDSIYFEANDTLSSEGQLRIPLPWSVTAAFVIVVVLCFLLAFCLYCLLKQRRRQSLVVVAATAPSPAALRTALSSASGLSPASNRSVLPRPSDLESRLGRSSRLSE